MPNNSEIELILACVRYHIRTGHASEIQKAVFNNIDWEYLKQTAYKHRVHHLVYKSLNRVCPDKVPAAILNELKRSYHRNEKRSLLFVGKLLSILKLLEQKNIPALAFKGPVLSEMVYGDFAARQFGDLDILVDQSHAFEVIHLLAKLGFKTELDLTEKQFSIYAEKKNSLPLESNLSGLNVDLHWEMTGHYGYRPFILETIKPGMALKEISKSRILQPCPEDLLVYLCLNATRDCFDTLESISSMAGLIISSETLDWDRIQRLADKMHCLRALKLILYMAQDLFHVSLPKKIESFVHEDAAVNRLKQRVYQFLFDESLLESNTTFQSKFSLFHFNVRDRWSEKIRWAKHLIIGATIQDWTVVDLPAGLSFMHCFLRPIRLSMVLFAQMAQGLKKLVFR